MNVVMLCNRACACFAYENISVIALTHKFCTSVQSVILAIRLWKCFLNSANTKLVRFCTTMHACNSPWAYFCNVFNPLFYVSLHPGIVAIRLLKHFIDFTTPWFSHHYIFVSDCHYDCRYDCMFNFTIP